MKKLKLLLACCICALIVAGCSPKRDESKLVKGTNQEIAMAMANDFKNDDYKDMYDKYVFNSNLDDLAKSGRVKSILEPQFNMLGTISSFEESFIEDVAGYQVIHIPTHFAEGDLNIEITFDSDNAIYNISFNQYALSLEG